VRSRLRPDLTKRSNPARSASLAAAAYSLREVVGNKPGMAAISVGIRQRGYLANLNWAIGTA
jgi:hypothetical protein